MPEPDRADNVPGMEFIDESAGQADTAEAYPETEEDTAETENAEALSELPEAALSEPDRYAEDFPEDDLSEPDRNTEDFPEDTLSVSDAMPATDPVQYQTMEELLAHAEDMKPDDLANALARALSGGQDADRSGKGNAFSQSPSKRDQQNLDKIRRPQIGGTQGLYVGSGTG